MNASEKRSRAAYEMLQSNQDEAIKFVQRTGLENVQKLLQESASELEQRISQKVKAGAGENFTLTQMRTTLAQVKEVLRSLIPRMRDHILDLGEEATNQSAQHTIDYLQEADESFRGVGTSPLAIDEASMLDNAQQGVRSSILRRLASSGEPIADVDEVEHPAKMGILERYGVETIGHFERELQKGFVQKRSWEEMADRLTDHSPFLQEAPRYWADRIVRTESMRAYNAAGWESIREVNQENRDMVKFLSCVYDSRTGADSISIQGQCRRPEEAFESWYGYFQHPPDRPNDRGIVVPHRIAWPIPPYLFPNSPEEIAARWHMEGNKRPMPDRPLITTVSFADFGR